MAVRTIPCAIARDLMSLEDGIQTFPQASAILNRHLEECPACAAVYSVSFDPLTQEKISPAESEAFRQKSRKKARKNALRTALRLAAAFILTLALVLLGANIYSYLSVSNFDVPLTDFDYTLYADEDGFVYGLRRFKDGAKTTRTSLGERISDGTLEIEHTKPIIDSGYGYNGAEKQEWLCLKLIDGQLWYMDERGLTPLYAVTEIRLVCRHGKDYRVLWQAGEGIPAAERTPSYSAG